MKQADIIFLDNADGTVLDLLVQRHFKKVPSIFAKSGFGVCGRKSAEHLDREVFYSNGFANDLDFREWGYLQCMASLNVPGRYLKLAILVEGYGGSPPKEVDGWIHEMANHSTEPALGAVR